MVTIATYNLFFGLLMFFSGGVSLYDIPDWWTTRVTLVGLTSQAGTAELTLPVPVMVVCAAVTWFLLRRTSTGRQLYAMATIRRPRAGLVSASAPCTIQPLAGSGSWPASRA